MIIEQQSDRNMTGSGWKDRRVRDMIDLKQAHVADHIARLEREGAALRAERANTRAALAIARAMVEPVRLPVVRRGSPRVRVGRWLVTVGASIAGTAEPVTRALDECAGDSSDTFSHAA